VRLWDGESGSLLLTEVGHDDEVISVSLTEVNGRAIVASGSDDGAIRLWDGESGDLLWMVAGLKVQVASVSRGVVNGRAVMASGSFYGTMRLWDGESNGLIETRTEDEGLPPGFAADRTMPARAGIDGHTIFADLTGGNRRIRIAREPWAMMETELDPGSASSASPARPGGTGGCRCAMRRAARLPCRLSMGWRGSPFPGHDCEGNGAPYGSRTRLYNVKGCRPNR
jgi:WD domain, G-beta repeat